MDTDREPLIPLEQNVENGGSNAEERLRDENVHSEVKALIDGVQILASSWNFVFPMKNVRIASPLYVKREKTRSILKGCRYISGSEYVWSVYLFEACDLTIKVLFWGDFDTLAYDQIVKMIYKSIDQSISKFPDSNTSKCALQKVQLGSRRTKRDILKIICTDYYEIGCELSKKIRINLHTMFEDPVFFAFVGVCMGQNMELDYMTAKLLSLNTTYMLEVLLHHAYDCVCPQKLLLWRRDAIVVRMNGRPPSYEYYPLGVPNNGNFYYNQLGTISTNDTRQSSHVTNWKCYGENSKHVHDGIVKPFQKSEIGKFVMDFTTTGFLAQTIAAKKRLQTTAQLYIDQIEILDELVQSARDGRLNSARIEFIVSTMAPVAPADEISVFPQNFPYLSAAAALEYCERNQLISSRTLSVLDQDFIYSRYSLYFPPISALLKKHLLGVMEYLTNPVIFFEFTFADYLNMLAAEAVVSFLIYGTAVSTDKKKHNNNLCRDLGIVGHRFRHVPDNLYALHFGRSVLHLVPDVTHTQFRYQPKFDWTLLLEEIQSPVNMSRIVQCCSSSHPIYIEMAKILMDVLIFSSLSLVNAATHVLSIHRTTTYSNFYENCEYQTSFQLCQFLFSMNSSQAAGHFGLLWLIRHVVQLLKTKKKIYTFKLCFARFFDDIMHREKTFFVISFPNKRVTTFIIPFLNLVLEPNRNTQLTRMLNLYKIKYWKRQKEEPHAGLRALLEWLKMSTEVELIAFENLNTCLQRIYTISQRRLFEAEDIVGFTSLT